MSRAGITVSIKGEINDLEAKITQSKEIINDATKQIIAENGKLKASQDAITNAQKTYSSEIASATNEIKKHLDIKSQNGKLTKDEQKNLAAAKAELALYKIKTSELVDVEKQRQQEIRRTINATKELSNIQRASIADSRLEIDTKRKIIAAENEVAASKNNSEKSTSNLANTTIRYLRWAGTIAGVVYAGKRAWDLTAGSGIAVNKIIENNTYGIAALISANTQMVDSLGKTLTPMEKFNMGQTHAKKVIAELRTESTKTAATFPQLLEIFQQGIGKTLAMGDAFGSTTEEIEKNTIKLASRMSNFANAIGMPMDRVKEEMRSLVSGNASTDSLIATIIFGSPGEANKAIKEAETKVNGVADLLNKKFTPFDILAETKTFDKSVLAVQDSWSRAMGDMVEKSGAFKDITNIFYDMSKDITNNTDDIVKAFDGMYNGVKTIFTALNTDAAGYIAALAGVVATLNIIARLNPYVAGATVVGGTIVASQTNKQKELDSETKAEIDKINKLVSESKTQETDKALINVLEEKIKQMHKVFDASNFKTPEIAASLTQQQTAIREQITLLEKRKDITKEDREIFAKFELDQGFIKDNKQVGDLIANIKMDTERIKEDEKEILKTKGNTAEWEAEIAKYQKNKLESVTKLQKAEEAQAQATKTNGEANKIIAADIATLKKDIANQDLLIGLKQSKIAEENQKDADISFKKAETLLNKKKEQNKQDSENKAVLLELSMLQSGQIDEERLKISLSQLEIQTKQEEAKYLQEGLDKNKLLVKIEKEKLNLRKLQTEEEIKKQKQYKFDQISGSIKYSDMANLGQIYQELLVYYKEDPESLADLQTWVEREQNKLSKKPLVIDVKLQGWDEVSNSIATFGNSFQDINKAQKKYQQENEKVIKDEVALGQARVDLRDTTISGIADMTGAIASFYDEDDSRRKKQLELQKFMNATKMAMQLAELAQTITVETAKGQLLGTNALIAQLQLPFPANIPAYAMVAGMLASLGIMIGGSTKTSTTSDAFSAQLANTGTGSVLGDTSAQSESIVNALSILEDFASPQYKTLQSMNKYLANISNNISGISSLLIQSGGFAFGEGYSGFDTGYKNNLFTSKGGAMALNPINDLIAKIPIIGQVNAMFGSILNSVIGGLFGKKSVSQALTDSGIYFADTLLTSAIKQFNGQSYQTISTTVKKKSWFGSSESTSVESYFNELDSETERQFSLVLDNLYNTVLTAGEALDSASIDTAKSLDNFVVSIGKISLKDKTGTQIQDALKSIFGEIGDDITKAAFPLLSPFQQIGEGMFETLTRVATGMEDAEYYIGKLGKAFSDISYTEIINKQGDVGFETLLQSIVKADEASYGFNNNLVKIITSLDSTAEELYSAYTTLDSIRETLKFLKINTDALSYATIRGAGSIEALSSGVSAYIENFLTDSEQLAYSTTMVQKEFARLNIEMPKSKEGFKSLLSSIDTTTESGQQLYGQLIILSESFAEIADKSVSKISDIKNSFMDMLNTIDETINNLLGRQVGADQTEVTITSYLQKREQADILLNKGSSITEVELSTLNSLVSDLASMASTIQGGYGDNTNITGNLVQDLTSIKSKINYANKFITGFKDGGYTGNGPIDEIAGYTHKNEYVIKASELQALGGPEEVRNMVQREIVQKNTNNTTSSVEYSNDKSGIMNQLQKGQQTIVDGFNAMIKKLDDITDYYDRRIEEKHSVTVTGSVIIEG